MARKARENDVEYIEDKLAILRDQMDKAEKYLRENPWDEIKDPDRREKEFKFQKDLSTTLMSWNESYINQCGIMDVYKKLEEANKKGSLRSGMAVSGIQKYVKERAVQPKK